MPERTVTIVNAKGLHARASARFVKLAEEFASDITVRRKDGKGGGETVSGKSILDLLMLAAEKGTALIVTARGKDAETALDALARLVERHFDES